MFQLLRRQTATSKASGIVYQRVKAFPPCACWCPSCATGVLGWGRSCPDGSSGSSTSHCSNKPLLFPWTDQLDADNLRRKSLYKCVFLHLNNTFKVLYYTLGSQNLSAIMGKPAKPLLSKFKKCDLNHVKLIQIVSDSLDTLKWWLQERFEFINLCMPIYVS